MNEEEFEELLRFQRLLASSIVRENEMDNKIKLINLLNSMVHGKKKRISVESVILEAQMEGMSESEVMRLLGKLKEDHIITEIDSGFVRLI